MRLEYSAKNLAVSWAGQICSVLLSFVVRMVFVRTLAQNYLGVESLFSSILSVLSLAELGIGSAIVFALYGPLAHKDYQQIRALMKLYKWAYWIIAALVALCGFVLSFHLELFINNPPHIPHLNLIFLMFVANTSLSYLYSYKGALIGADQQRWIVALIQYAFQAALALAQIAVLLLTKNYMLFLACMLVASIAQNFVLSYKANQMYPFLKQKDEKTALSSDVKSSIKKNTAALMLHKIAGAASVPASNVILSQALGLGVVAIYANYLMVTTALTRIVDQVFDAITASIGNLAACEGLERQNTVFNHTMYLNVLLYAVTSAGLLCAFQPFIGFAFGEKYIFSMPVVGLIVLLFYCKGIRSSALSFTSALGLYWHTRYKALIESAVLLTLSIVFVRLWGIAGILIANIISCLSVSFTMEGYMLCKHGLRRSFIRYALTILTLSLRALVAIAACFALCESLNIHGIVGFIINGALACTLSTLIFIALTWKHEERTALFNMVKRVARMFRKRSDSTR